MASHFTLNDLDHEMSVTQILKTFYFVTEPR